MRGALAAKLARTGFASLCATRGGRELVMPECDDTERAMKLVAAVNQ